MVRHPLLILCLLLNSASSIPSTQKIDSAAQLAKEVSSPVPVVFGKKDDGLPEELLVVGRISKVSFSRPCGVVYWSGTIKIQPLQKIPNYPHKNVFVVVNCLQDSQNEKKYLNKVVKLKLSKLYPEQRMFRNPDTFFFELIDNTIDSGGVPFYYTNAGREKILNH